MYFCPAPESRPNRQKDPGDIIIRFSDRPDDYWSTIAGGTVKGAIEIPDEGGA